MAILFDDVMTFCGSIANDVALNAYVTDVTDYKNRCRVIDGIQILTWIAILITYGASGLIIDAWGYILFSTLLAL
jgi:hypothetical protein